MEIHYPIRIDKSFSFLVSVTQNQQLRTNR